MSVGAASRLHYWKYHPEIMLAGHAKAGKTPGPKKKAAATAKRKAPATKRAQR
jgi:hypothetical protein